MTHLALKAENVYPSIVRPTETVLQFGESIFGRRRIRYYDKDRIFQH